MICGVKYLVDFMAAKLIERKTLIFVLTDPSVSQLAPSLNRANCGSHITYPHNDESDAKKHVGIVVVDYIGFVSLAAALVYPILDSELDKTEGMFAEK